MPIESINSNRCNGCGICEKTCSMDVIRIDKETRKAVIKYREDCMACFLCEMDCPAEAIYVTIDKGIIPVLPFG